MHREAEEQAAIFADSWDRLAWVEQQVERVRTLCEPWSQLPIYAPLAITVDESASSEGRFEFMVDVQRLLELPLAANFILGNIVTDARSCLDMAIEALWSRYALDRKGVIVQFPLEDDFTKKCSEDARLRKFLSRLDDKFVEVIEQAQPDYVDGLLGIPENLSALFISHLSNANKHRNITPVVFRVALSMMGTDKLGLNLALIDDSSHGVPPLRFALNFDIGEHSEQDARSFIAALERPYSTPLHVEVSQRLVVDRQEIPLLPRRLGDSTFSFRAGLDDLLTKVPEYIRFTLRNLNRVHHNIQNGGNEVYLLDRNGTL